MDGFLLGQQRTEEDQEGSHLGSSSTDWERNFSTPSSGNAFDSF